MHPIIQGVLSYTTKAKIFTKVDLSHISCFELLMINKKTINKERVQKHKEDFVNKKMNGKDVAFIMTEDGKVLDGIHKIMAIYQLGCVAHNCMVIITTKEDYEKFGNFFIELLHAPTRMWSNEENLWRD